MELSTRDAQDVRIVDFQGDLDSNTASSAEAYLNELIDAGAKNVLLNLEHLDFMSSAGLRVLLATAKRLQSMGGGLRVCCLNETVQEIFEMSGFISILNVTKTEQESLDAF
jgi:anti-sigma B factor antagonist